MRRLRRIASFDLVVLTAFAAVSLWVLGLDVWQVIAHGRSWTGTDGVLPQDQMQYLAWIRSASEHALASNLFVLRPTPAVYFQPMIAVSGAISALGVAPWLALLVWKPVAVGAAFFAIRSYAHRVIAGRWPRRTALVLALFFGFFGVKDDLWLGFWTWGYPFELVALAAMLCSLLAYERAHTAGRRSWSAPLLGALTSSLHPWQGETLIIIVVLAEALTRPDRGRWRASFSRAAVTVIATAVPLAYYAILTHTDMSWKLAQAASRGSSSLPQIALALAPLILPAALACRRRPRTFIAAAARTWPLAALGVFLLSETRWGNTPLHAFAGISVPLAVLAVDGVGGVGLRRRWSGGRYRPLLAALAVAAVTIPVTVHELSFAAQLVVPTTGDANFISHDERDALAFLAGDKEAGGVLTGFYLGTVVPAISGRQTFVGNCFWSQPDCSGRARMATELLAGSLTPGAARSFVRSSSAGFVLADCATRANLVELLGPLVRSTHRFGCAAVYVIVESAGGRFMGDLAAPNPPR